MNQPFMDFTQDGENVRIRVVLPDKIQIRYMKRADWISASQIIAQLSTEIPEAVLNHLKRQHGLKFN